ncbi:MAG: glycosyltransferase [Verrucomicrobia bacterium]|nr:glycosyltransferase [Verrucomicrobiota bacterium]
MPVYNGAATLRQAVESVLAQTFTDYELILVDDASTDDSAAIARSFGDRVRLVQRARNSGLCEIARSEGLALAWGRYCALLDQDDLWAPEKLQRQTAFMEAHPELLLSHTQAWVMDAEGRRNGIRHEGLIPPTGPCARELLDHCFITISTIMVRGRAWLDAGEATSLKSANSDFLYFFSLLRKSPAGFGFLAEPLASYRRWPQGMSRGRWKWTPEDVPALIDLSRSGLWKGLVTRRQVRAAIARACLINAEHHYYEGQFRRVLYFVLRGWPRRPLDLRLPGWLVKAAAKKVMRRK